MKNFYLIVCFLGLVLTSASLPVAAKKFENELNTSSQSKTDHYIRFVYNKIKFNKHHKLAYEAFKSGFYGYLNMIEEGKISSGALLSICDFSMSSNEKRLWVIDVKKKKVLFNSLVAHGTGTGEEFATAFSNIQESHQSSLGFYTTAETYEGNNGYSLKLNGVDGIFNSNAYERAIVIHGADYVSEEFAKANQRIGRSHGCPALPTDIAAKVIDKIKNGSCFFIYYPSKNYLGSSYWLKSKIKSLPQEADEAELLFKNSNNNADEDCEAELNANQKESKDLPVIERKISSIVIINETGKHSVADTILVK